MTTITPTFWPAGWRKAQTLFNFLEWLAEEKGYPTEQSSRMADPFHISDETWDKLYLEYMKGLRDRQNLPPPTQ